MDTNEYFDKLNKALDNTTDEELEKLLIESGTDSCNICMSLRGFFGIKENKVAKKRDWGFN